MHCVEVFILIVIRLNVKTNILNSQFVFVILKICYTLLPNISVMRYFVMFKGNSQ